MTDRKTHYLAGLKLFGQDTSVLYKLAEEAARRLETVEGVEDISRPRGEGRREIRVSLDRDRATAARTRSPPRRERPAPRAARRAERRGARRS